MGTATDPIITVDAVMARNFLPVMAGKGQHPLTNVWIPNAVADPLLFLATINFAAAHLDFLHGRSTSSRTIAQKVETIRLINLRLPESNLSDSTIGAVAMLAAMEVSGQYSIILLEDSCTSWRLLQLWTAPDDNYIIPPAS